MTTIAFKDGKLAGDSGVFVDHTFVGLTTKVLRNHRGQVGGLCGESADADRFRQWFEEGANGSPPKFVDENSAGLLAHPDGGLEWVGSERRARMEAECYAIGSGHQVALGAMLGGCSAKRAVEIACSVNIYTRGPVTEVSVGA